MALAYAYYPYTLQFTFAAGTSRGVLREKKTWFLKLWDEQTPEVFGLGEAGPLVGLSIDDRPEMRAVLEGLQERIAQADVPTNVEEVYPWVQGLVSAEWPSIRFGLETAMLDLLHGGQRRIIDTPFVRWERTILINGLVWMGDAPTMQARLEEKLAQGFTTIKVKIGAIDFEEELRLLALVRERFEPDQITLRVDANGAFSPEEAPQKLKQLAEFQLHSIEQPIMAGQWQTLAALCADTPIPIALDEELIGVHEQARKAEVLDTIQPQFIILKPTLVGGLYSSTEWIELARARGIDYWMTSALESNVGLNAVAQFTDSFDPVLPSGLGTGQLYHNNIPSPLAQSGGYLRYGSEEAWDFSGVF